MSEDVFAETTGLELYCDKYWYTILYAFPANFFSSIDTIVVSLIGAEAVGVDLKMNNALEDIYQEFIYLGLMWE